MIYRVATALLAFYTWLRNSSWTERQLGRLPPRWRNWVKTWADQIIITVAIVAVMGGVFLNPVSPLSIMGMLPSAGPEATCAPALTGVADAGASGLPYLKGFDLSYSVPSCDWLRARRAEGYTVIAQGLWTGREVPGNPCLTLGRAESLGYITVGYASVTGAYPGSDNIAKAKVGLSACPERWDGLAMLAVDVQIRGVPLSDIIDAVRYSQSLGQRTTTYTSCGMWSAVTGNAPAPTDTVWAAYWDGREESPQAGLARCSIDGFQRAIGKQYTGGTNFEGVSVDFDTWDLVLLEWVGQAQPPSPPPQEGWIPWPGYNLTAGRWLEGDFSGDGVADRLHICCADYGQFWLGKGDGAFVIREFRPWPGYGMQSGAWLVADLDRVGGLEAVHVWKADAVNVFYFGANGAIGRVVQPQ